MLILSAMRTGSTLLKALLGSAPDVSHLPEFDFQRLDRDSVRDQVRDLSVHPIVVLKRPAWLHEIRTYPRIPKLGPHRKIVLVRDAYETVTSIRRMVFRRWHSLFQGALDSILAEHYWCGVYRRLAAMHRRDPKRSVLVRYEKLLANPEDETRRLFDFVGSAQRQGVRTYDVPVDGAWQWGRDDGSERIRTREVLPPRRTRYDNERLLRTIRKSRRIARLRTQFGYGPLPEGAV